MIMNINIDKTRIFLKTKDIASKLHVAIMNYKKGDISSENNIELI